MPRATEWPAMFQDCQPHSPSSTLQAVCSAAKGGRLSPCQDSTMRCTCQQDDPQSSNRPSACVCAEGKIPVEYEDEIRRMLKLDDASRGPSVGHSPRLSTHPVPSPGQGGRSGPATPLLTRPGTGDELGGEATARVSLPGAWLGQGLKAIAGRLVETEKAASRLKAGVVVLALAILLLLQVRQLAACDWSRVRLSQANLSESSIL